MPTKSPKQEISITITTPTYLRLIFLTVASVGVVVAIQQASHSLLLVACAFFLALALNGPVQKISRVIPGKRKGSRIIATAISFIIVIGFLGGFIASIAPPLVKQTNSFVKAAPDLIKDFRSQDSATGRAIRHYNLESQIDNVSKQLSDRAKQSSGKTFTVIQTIGASLFSMLTILVLTFMMLIEGPRWFAFALDTFPKAKRARAKRLSVDMYKVVKGFVNGQVTLAALASAIILPALLILDISYPVALMVIVFTCGLIPLVGHTIGALIVATVALFESSSAALIILAYYIGYQQIENYFIQPKVQANATNMSPLLIFMAVIIGVSFGGLFAGLFAIPLAGIIRILVLEYLNNRNMITDKEYKEEISTV